MPSLNKQQIPCFFSVCELNSDALMAVCIWFQAQPVSSAYRLHDELCAAKCMLVLSHAHSHLWVYCFCSCICPRGSEIELALCNILIVHKKYITYLLPPFFVVVISVSQRFDRFFHLPRLLPIIQQTNTHTHTQYSFGCSVVRSFVFAFHH